MRLVDMWMRLVDACRWLNATGGTTRRDDEDDSNGGSDERFFFFFFFFSFFFFFFFVRATKGWKTDRWTNNDS